MVGFVLLNRKILEWEWYQSPVISRVYIHLILRANYLNKKWQGIDVKRGQFITSNDHLARELSLSIQNIRTALGKLDSSGYIIRQTTNRFTLITITNYDVWQSAKALANMSSNKLSTNKQQTVNTQLTTTKEGNNKNNLKKETIERRKEKFKNEVFAHSNYSNKILESFFNYWSELNPQQTKMRFETEQFFEVEKRLKKWKANERSNINSKSEAAFQTNRKSS